MSCGCGCAGSGSCALQENLAETEEIKHGVGGPARLAEVEVCDSKQCDVAHLLVRGDRIEFVSPEQMRKHGRHPLDPKKMPSDVKLPRGYVLVQDTTGQVLERCDFYIVKWHRGGATYASNVLQNDLKAAQDYFGDASIHVGTVDIPEGPWKKIGKVNFIRYRRYGFSKHFEHEYTPSVDLYYSQRPLAWKLALPSGCVVDSRGFVVP